MPCRHCGATMVEGSTFCPNCGTPVIQPDAGYLPPAMERSAGPASAPVQKVTNGLAITSMVLGIVWIGWLGSILALVFGYIAKKQINQSGGRQGGKGMAIAGIVLGWIGVALGIGSIALIVVAYMMGNRVGAPMEHVQQTIN